jgi:hypothetical protein
MNDSYLLFALMQKVTKKSSPGEWLPESSSGQAARLSSQRTGDSDCLMISFVFEVKDHRLRFPGSSPG